MAHMIDRHPQDGVDFETEIAFFFDTENLTPDDKRYVAECEAVRITKGSTTERCANVFAKLLIAHVDQLNAQIADRNAGHQYSNPIELIRKESDKKKNKEIKHTGNIASAHETLKALDNKIVSEETPKQMLQWIFWCLLFGIGFLALAMYSVKTGGAVNLMTWILDSKWFLLLFCAVTIGLSLYFGFASAGVLMVGGLLVLAWIALKLPGLTSFVLNGALFLIAAILLFTVVFYIVSLIKYKPLPEEAHLQNQAYIAQKNALKKELNEYSDLMLEKLDVIKQKFVDNDTPFRNELSRLIAKGDYAIFSYGEVSEFFSFLNKYYRKMRR